MRTSPPTTPNPSPAERKTTKCEGPTEKQLIHRGAATPKPHSVAWRPTRKYENGRKSAVPTALRRQGETARPTPTPTPVRSRLHRGRTARKAVSTPTRKDENERKSAVPTALRRKGEAVKPPPQPRDVQGCIEAVSRTRLYQRRYEAHFAKNITIWPRKRKAWARSDNMG